MSDIKRDTSIDIAKGIGMFLVVLGHFLYFSDGVSAYVRDIIYSFHMPLFFIISGFLYKPLNTFPTIKKVLPKYVIPAYLTVIIDVIICFMRGVNRLGNPITKQSYFFTALLTGGLGDSLVVNDPLWYLISFAIILVVKSIYDKGRFWQIVIPLGCISIIVIKHTMLKESFLAMSWYANWTCGFLFFQFGAFLKKLDFQSFRQRFHDWQLCVIAIVEFVIVLFGAKINGMFVIASFAFGESVALALLLGVIGSDFVLILSHLIAKYFKSVGKPLSYIGQHGLFILSFHYYVIYLFFINNRSLSLSLLYSIVTTVSFGIIIKLYNVAKQKVLNKSRKELVG